MKDLFVLNKYILRYKGRLIIGTICVILSNYFKALVPLEIGEALDFIVNKVSEMKDQGISSSAFNAEMGDSLFTFGLTVLGYAMIMGIFMYFMRQTIIYNSRLIEYDLRKDIYNHYQNLDVSFYKKNNTGDLMARITEDVSKVRMYLGPALLYGINLTSLFVMVIYSMIKINPTLSFYTLLPLPLLSISIYLVSSVINKKSEAIQKQLASLNSFAQEVYSGIHVIKSYVKEESFGQAFDEESETFKSKSLELAKVNAMFYPLMILLVSVSTILTVVVGGIQVSKGLATPGNIAQFIIYVNMLTWPVTAIGWIASIIQQASASMKRINEFQSIAPVINNVNQEKYHINGQIEFRDVSFTYPNSGIEALQNVSFRVDSGEKLVLLGKTASGKSTIAELLLRMYDVTEGQILIDGKDIKDHNLDAIRRSIGYVPQDVFLFSDTATKNVQFGNDAASFAEVQEYTDYAAVRDDIESLPEKFETRIGERGVTLSGGQKQRLSIARALIKEPQIVILDDCLSAVDTTTEQKILQYLKQSLAEKSAIIITHRIMPGFDVDRIIVLEEGKISEIGTPSELYAQKGFYFDMLNEQKEEKQLKSA